MGYTPLFDSLIRGTLCGKWPDIGLWPIVLSLADRHGVVDATPAYLAQNTGLSLEEVQGCLARFCEPDPYSRSQEKEGRRLMLLDPARPWGWQVVNFGFYREKARLMAKASSEVSTGKNRERLRTAADRRSPPATAPHTQTNTKTKTEEKNPTAVAKRDTPAWFSDFRAAYPKRGGDQPWRSAERSANARLTEGHTPGEFIEGAKRYAAFIRALGKEGTEFVKQASTFLGPDKPFLESWDLPATKADARFAMNADTAIKWAEETL